jgi:predicted RNase H-like nuclease (RuvC/YqgF family)
MANRAVYVERDRHGRQCWVRTSDRLSPSRNRLSTRELLDAAEEREMELIAGNQALQERLNRSRANEDYLRKEYHDLANDHHQCRNLRAQLDAQLDENRRLRQKLQDSKDENGELKEEIRLLKRSSRDYRQRYEEKVKDVDILRTRLLESEGLLHSNNVRLAEKDKIIADLEEFLRRRGYRVGS